MKKLYSSVLHFNCTRIIIIILLLSRMCESKYGGGDNNNNNNNNKTTTTTTYVCDVPGGCKQSYDENVDLMLHMCWVHECCKGALQCVLCEQTFADAAHVRTHVQTVHRQLKPHACPQCTYKCAQAIQLRVHCRRVHPSPRWFIMIYLDTYCVVCVFLLKISRFSAPPVSYVNKRKHQSVVVENNEVVKLLLVLILMSH